MNSKFCPKCGVEEQKDNLLIDGLCQKCFSKENPLLLKFKDPKIIICNSCNSYMYKNKWHPNLAKDPLKNLKKIISKLFYEKLEFNPEAKITKVEINPLPPKDSQIKQKPVQLNIELKIEGILFDKKLKETYEIPLKINSSICNICKKKTSNYYEAILQIRPKSKQVLDFIKENINFKKDVFITKQEDLKYGYDIYLTSQSYTKHLAGILKKKFNGEFKISHTLFGRKEGKDVYRTTILIKLKE